MGTFITYRVLQAIPVLLIVVSATFFLMRAAPGGPFDDERALPPEVQKQVNAYYGLDKPLWQQYFIYLKQLLHGDFGPSFRYPNRSVREILASGLPITIELAVYALLVALFIGLLAGVLASLRPNTPWDYMVMAIAMIGICIPALLFGPFLVWIFGISWEWLPVSGWGYSPGDKILPAITLGAAYAAYIARLTRAGMLEVFTQEFVRTAYAKGLSTPRVVLRHAIYGGLLPVVSFLGPALAGLLSGSFVVETIFNIPGIGRFFVQAAFNRDYTLIMGTTIFFATIIVVFNLLSEILLAWLDPRVRLHNE